MSKQTTPQTPSKPVLDEAFVTLGKTKKDNVVVNYLLLNMAKLILVNLNPDDPASRAVKDAAERTQKRLQASHTVDELEPVKVMAKTTTALAKKLVQCQDVAQLEASLTYMERLLENEVYIVPDETNPQDHGLTPNL